MSVISNSNSTWVRASSASKVARRLVFISRSATCAAQATEAMTMSSSEISSDEYSRRKYEFTSSRSMTSETSIIRARPPTRSME